MEPLNQKFSSENNPSNLTDKHFYILVMTDIYGRWTEVSFLKNKKSADLSNKLEKSDKKIGIPEAILSDQGRNFILINFKNLTEQ